MKNIVSYGMEIKDEYRCFFDTISIYQEAVEFLISVADEKYDCIRSLDERAAEINTKLKLAKREFREGLYIEEILK